MKLKCNLIKADEPTINNRIYPRKVLEEAIENYNAKSEEEKFGELAPKFEEKNNMKYYSFDLDLDNISHKILNLELNEDGYMVGEVEVLNTRSGKDLQKLWKGELTLFPRIVGNLENGVITDISVMSIDMEHHYKFLFRVNTPYFQLAFMN